MLLLELIKVNLSPISTANLHADGHQNLQFELCHPSHTKSSIVFSQALKMRRTCPKRGDLVANVEKLKDWFSESGYPQDIVNKDTNRALETPSLGCSKTSERSVPSNGINPYH